MTTICAMYDPEGGVWIGSDSMASNCGTVMRGVEKWIVRAPWAVGIAGDMRAINLVNREAEKIFADDPAVMTLVDRIRDVLRYDEFGSIDDNDGGAKNFGQQMILARPGGIWSVGAGFDVVPIPVGELWADGSGRGFALGAGEALRGRGLPRGSVMRRALEAALRYDKNSGGEIFLQLVTEPSSAAADE